MDRPSGSFITDKDGKLKPNLEDEAMTLRQTQDEGADAKTGAKTKAKKEDK